MSKEEENSQATPLKLYWSSGSPYCRKVQMALMEKKLEYESHPICLLKKEHEGNPCFESTRKKVPLLLDGNVSVYESNAIILYLEDKFKENPLMPEDPVLKAMCYTRMIETDYVGHSLLAFRPFFMDLKKKVEKNQQFLCHYGRLMSEFARWNDYLDETPYIVGDTLTVADVCFFPYLALSVRFGLDILTRPEFGNLLGYWNLMNERKSVIDSIPPHWQQPTRENNLNILRVELNGCKGEEILYVKECSCKGNCNCCKEMSGIKEEDDGDKDCH